jgi:hypothetical protein
MNSFSSIARKISQLRYHNQKDRNPFKLTKNPSHASIIFSSQKGAKQVKNVSC